MGSVMFGFFFVFGIGAVCGSKLIRLRGRNVLLVAMFLTFDIAFFLVTMQDAHAFSPFFLPALISVVLGLGTLVSLLFRAVWKTGW